MTIRKHILSAGPMGALGALCFIIVGCAGHSDSDGMGVQPGTPGAGGAGGSIPAVEGFYPQPEPEDPQEVPLLDLRRSDCTVVEDAYGPYDRLPFEKTVYYYDEAGHLAASEFDAGANGTLERKSRRIIDGQGRLILEEIDEGGEGIPDIRFLQEYDDAGRLAAQEQDSDGDGQVDVRREFGYDGADRLLSESILTRPENLLIERTIYTYGSGNGPVQVQNFVGPEQQLSWQLDSMYDDMDRPIERILLDQVEMRTQRTSITYDDAQRVSREELDVGGDGSLEARITKTYDNWNRIRSIETDLEADAVLELRVNYGWDGELLSSVGADTDGDGTDNETNTYVYDERGRLLRKVRDRDATDMLGGERWEYIYHCTP